MLLDSFADESRAGGENEVARHSLPDEMKVVAVVPHVLTRAGNFVLLAFRVVCSGSRMSHAADVSLRVESADCGLSAEQWRHRREAQGKAERPTEVGKANKTVPLTPFSVDTHFQDPDKVGLIVRASCDVS